MTGKYLLCAWNVIEAPDKNDILKDDPRADAITRFLSACGFQTRTNPEDEAQADLVVLLPRDNDPTYTTDELAFLSRGLGGKAKKVLYMHGTAAYALREDGKLSNSLFLVRSAGFDHEDLTKWLTNGVGEPAAGSPASLAEWHKFLQEDVRGSALSRRWDDFVKDVFIFAKQQDENLSRSGKLLFELGSLAALYFGVHRMSAKFAALEHKLNRAMQEENIDWADYARKKEFVQACVNLRNAMALSCLPMPDTKKQNLVLFIDDNPGVLPKKIQAMLNKISNGLRLRTWDPTAPVSGANKKDASDFLCLEDMEGYQSLVCATDAGESASDHPHASKYVCFSGVNSTTLFVDSLKEARFIFVDILLKDASGRDAERGYAVIRGLHRFLRDFFHVLKKDEKHKDLVLPDIMAISRADDLDTVRKAISAGASGYVLKGQLLGLATALMNNRLPALEDTGGTRRNFRLLYDLPHETIGLLRHIAVPKNSFHISTAIDLSGALSHAQLLAVLPKPDLHVHVGSCMRPEFLVVASLVMLSRLADDKKALQECAKRLARILAATETGPPSPFFLHEDFDIRNVGDRATVPSVVLFTDVKEMFPMVADFVRKHIRKQVRLHRSKADDSGIQARYKILRSILHRELDIPDHQDEQDVRKALEGIQDIRLFLLALKYAGTTAQEPPLTVSNSDMVRLLLLWLASRDDYIVLYSDDQIELKASFTADEGLSGGFLDFFGKAHRLFWERKPEALFAPERFRRRRLLEEAVDVPRWTVTRGVGPAAWQTISRDEQLLAGCPVYPDDRIGYLLASGTRCENLRTYLGGCELSGAEHLQHPYLIHLYAQQAVHSFVSEGVMYAELRAAIAGYETKDGRFTFNDACVCAQEAFGLAQCCIQETQQSDRTTGWLWESPFRLENLFHPLRSNLARFRFPVKVSLILTGKRHKPTREMMREAAAGIVFHSQGANTAVSAQQFMAHDMRQCRIVGFDLAGPEDTWPPSLYRDEYERISRSHIPITAHAGENAPIAFVESAIFDLRANRLGHGLALASDSRLMNRAREQRICIELCPVSNFQTNQFVRAGASRSQREYPLRTFLANDVPVCINTDNPMISCTNLIKEYMQASFAYGHNGLSYWELLRILRTGFVQSFLSLPERRAMLELADQILFDLFSREDVVSLLRELAARQ